MDNQRFKNIQMGIKIENSISKILNSDLLSNFMDCSYEDESSESRAFTYSNSFIVELDNEGDNFLVSQTTVGFSTKNDEKAAFDFFVFPKSLFSKNKSFQN